jgi:hypothetical protein
MDPATWRARHLMYLEREINQTTLYVLQRPTVEVTSEVRRAAERYTGVLMIQRAQTIGAGDLYQRSVVLSRFLSSIKEKVVDKGHAPATAEYATARAEYDALGAQIDARRSKVLLDAKPAAPPIQPFKPTRVPRVSEDLIAASQMPGWSTGAGKDAPDYVLVLKEIP